uniref:Uncharacterized protein n=1 Tax=Octopus bimaculoides TaxID=37653 RepID=A0A0L8FM63_OCTBM
MSVCVCIFGGIFAFSRSWFVFYISRSIAGQVKRKGDLLKWASNEETWTTSFKIVVRGEN